MQLRRETNIYDDQAVAKGVASVEKKVFATYGICNTADNVAAKVVTLSDFSLVKGAQISVNFTYANTASSPTLNVNSTGAKAIWARGAILSAAYYWSAKSVHHFTYDGSHWVMDNAESQEEVFNRLTNKKANQGIYLSNGNLYINASMINTGTLSANYIYGGKLSSFNGKVYFDLNNSELCANKMVSAAANSNYNITVEFGTTTWPTSVSNYQGFRIYRTIDPNSGVYILPTSGCTFITSTGSLLLYSSSNAEVSIHGQKFSLYAQSPTTSSKFAQISSDIDTNMVNIHENLRVSGNIRYSGSLGSSDQNLKKNIQVINKTLTDAVGTVKIKSFSWKRDETNKAHVGVIAQEVLKAIEERGLDPYGLVEQDEKGLLSVDYNGFLLCKVAALENKIEEQEREIKIFKQVIHFV